ncbi:MAG: hypothetical protein IPJ79_14955 [Bacteroidetes bacterium]|nr:hypothetical protein [Bacteroidota bacterium]
MAPNAGTIIKDAFELSDSTFIIIGTAADSASNYISFVAEVDTMGNILSNKTYYVNALEFGTRNVDNTLSYTGDSGLNKVLFLKTDLAGNLLTCFKIDFASECFVSDIIATSDSGNIILATNDFGSSGMEKEFGSVIKIDKTGNIQWVKHFGGTYQTYVNDAKDISPDVYEMYGSSTSLESDTLYYLNHNIFVLRLDSAGNQLSCHVVFEINKEYAWKYFIKANGNRLFALSSGKAG